MVFLAFHSALVLLGTIWVGKNYQPATISLSYDIENLVAYPARAISILYELDCGNRIVDRCRFYLEQFHGALNPRGKSFRAKLMYSFTERSTGEADMAHTENGACLMDSSGSNMQPSPLGLEFGEFMMLSLIHI